MILKNTKVGDKFYLLKDNKADRMYLRIDMDPSKMFISLVFDELICGLDLTTYQIMCFNAKQEVEVEYDNVCI